MRKTVSIALVVLLILGLTGCAKLQDESFVIEEIERIVPNAEFVGVEKSTDEGKVYTFTNGEFEFNLEDVIEATDGGFMTNNQYTDYFEKIIDVKNSDIHQIIGGYDFETKLTVLDNLHIDSKITRFAQIQEVFEMCENIAKTIEAYLPTQGSSVFSGDMSLRIDAVSVNGESVYIAWEGVPLVKNKTYFSTEKIAYAELEYVDAVRNFDIADSTVTEDLFEKYKRINLSQIYINGELFESERYEPKIVYNIEDEQYYMVVGFGIKEDYNGGIEDNINREIVQQYYPDSDYTIRSSAGITTYKIGDTLFKVERNKDTDDLRFYENGKELDIADYAEISSHSSGATYYRFISVNDFAYLTGMEVVLVDDAEGAVYLDTK